MRESPVISLINSLRDLGASVTWHDPIVIEYKKTISEDLRVDIDLGIIATPHDIMDFSIWQDSGVNVIDLSISKRNFGWPKFL